MQSFFRRVTLLAASLVLAAGALAVIGSVTADAASAAITVRSAPPSVWTWPLDGVPVVVRGFAPPPRPWLAGHRGVDLAGREGLVVRAAGRGVVVYAGPVAGRGVVSVDHAGGLRTTYEPLSATVRAGQVVAAGESLGALEPGHAGCPVAACLHWGLRRGETYLDPLLLVRPTQVRLKPLARRSEHNSTRSASGARVSLVVDAPESGLRDMGIYLRARQRGVAQQLLHRAQISAALEQMGCGRVTQVVRGGMREASGRCPCRDDLARCRGIEPSATHAEQEGRSAV